MARALRERENEYSLLDRRIERDLVPATEHHGIGILPYFPLASGLLTGKVRRGESPPAGSRLSEARAAGYVTEAKLDPLAVEPARSVGA